MKRKRNASTKPAPPAKKPKVQMASMSHEQSRCQYLVRFPNAPSSKFRYGGVHAEYESEAKALKAAQAFLKKHTK